MICVLTWQEKLVVPAATGSAAAQKAGSAPCASIDLNGFAVSGRCAPEIEECVT